jgi:hypothetical protein
LVLVRVRMRMRVLVSVCAKVLARREAVMRVAGQAKNQASVRAADWAHLQARTVGGVRIQAMNQPKVESTARGCIRVNTVNNEIPGCLQASLGVMIQDSI